MPDIPVWLWSDINPNRNDLFDNVVEISKPTHSFEDKIKPLSESPFEKTIFWTQTPMFARLCMMSIMFWIALILPPRTLRCA